MKKRAYYKLNDNEGSIFINGITKEDFEILCKFLEIPISSVDGLNPLISSSPEMPEDMCEEKAIKEDGFVDCKIPEDELPFGGGVETSTESEKEFVAEKAPVEETAKTIVPETENTPKEENTPNKVSNEPDGKKYYFSILKNGEKALKGGPAKAISELKNYAKEHNITLIQEGATFFVLSEQDKIKLEQAYQPIK